MNLSFGDEHRLKSRKLIERLFKDGKSVKAYPVIGVLRVYEPGAPTKIGYSVSKKKFASAVDRNLIKRRMREASRVALSKGLINRNSGLALMLIYVDRKIQDFHVLEKAISKLLLKIEESNEQDIEQF